MALVEHKNVAQPGAGADCLKAASRLPNLGSALALEITRRLHC